jgi:hypothetical protein
MRDIIQFIATHAAWFYLACGLGSAACLVMFVRAQRNVKQALFGLEMEIAAASRKRAVRLFALTALLALSVFLIAVVVEPNLPPSERPVPTPTPAFYTPPPTFTNQTPTATAILTPTLSLTTETPVLGDTPTTAPDEETATLEPSPLATQPPGTICIITEPADGSQVDGEVTFVGSASTEQFLFYKLEAYGPQTGGIWASILGDVVSRPVIDGVLGTANLSGWQPGAYSVRLVIVDTTSNEVAGCYVSLNIPPP